MGEFPGEIEIPLSCWPYVFDKNLTESGVSLVPETVKNLSAMQETWIPESGTAPEEGNGNPLQYSCLGNPMDRRA